MLLKDTWWCVTDSSCFILKSLIKNFCIPLNSQIKDDEDPDTLLVYEFLPDFHGGYKRETKPTVINKMDVLYRIEKPILKTLGKNIKTFLFKPTE